MVKEKDDEIRLIMIGQYKRQKVDEDYNKKDKILEGFGKWSPTA